MKIGILGAGQLARMLALAAHPLGIEIRCVDPAANACASKVAPVLPTTFSDFDTIVDFFKEVDCISYETENLPIEQIIPFAKKYTLLPSIEALKITQDRLFEKQLLNELNIPTALYRPINQWEDLEKSIDELKLPLILKTRRSGYDGKGQAVIRNLRDAKNAWQQLSLQELIVEQWVPFDFEVSMIAVRNKHGEEKYYSLIRNVHENGILKISEAPFENVVLQSKAQEYISKVMKKLNYVGLLTIEFFVVKNTLIANEIAPRVHNSGHWTIEGAETSQFENHLRALLDLPLGSTKNRQYSAMLNLISKQPDYRSLLKIPGLHYHWYEKTLQPNRKLGHLTLCDDNFIDLQNKLKNTLKILS